MALRGLIEVAERDNLAGGHHIFSSKPASPAEVVEQLEDHGLTLVQHRELEAALSSTSCPLVLQRHSPVQVRIRRHDQGQGITLGLALIAAGLAVQPVVGAQAAPSTKAEPSVISRLRDAASGSVDLRSNPATGRVGFARAQGASGDLLAAVDGEGRQGAVSKASDYVSRFASAFGAGAGELKQTEVYDSPSGYSSILAARPSRKE